MRVAAGVFAAAAALMMILMSAQSPVAARPIPRLVFATYMTCCPLGGNDQTFEEYRKEIRQAQEAGIDGFALDISLWPSNSRQKTNVDRLFDAADELGSGFKLFIMADQGNPKGGLSPETMALLLRRFGGRPSYYRYENKLFLSTYLGTEGWIQQVRSRAAADRKDLHVVPFLSDRKGWAIPSFARSGNLRSLVSDPSAVDGYFSFRVVGAPAFQSEVMTKLGGALKRSGKTYMAGVTPYYRRASPSLTIEDGKGVSKIVAGLQAARLGGADWVQLVTWNDWEESTYLQPFDAAQVTSTNGRWKGLLDHGPILRFLTPFIREYKTGALSADRDRAILMYRPTLKARHCGPEVDDVRRRGLRNAAIEGLRDDVYAAVLLKKPATLHLSVGKSSEQFAVGAGYHQFALPAQEGQVSAKVVRDGTTVLVSQKPLPIDDAEMTSCFNLYSAELVEPGR